MENTQLVIGKGLVFPFLLANGKPELGEPNECIKASIANILGWPITFKLMDQDFGSKLFFLLGEPNDDVTSTLAYHFVADAIELQEKRISLLDVKFSISNERSLLLQLDYIINSSGKRESTSLTVSKR